MAHIAGERESTTFPVPQPLIAPKHRDDIQGLRALAVILVILDHARINAFRGGFVGVDVFFVISGYVITGLLMQETKLGIRNKLLVFYSRRVRRIIPASTMVLIVTLIGGYHWLGTIAGRSLGTDERWASLFLANWHFTRVSTDYFSTGQASSVILHFWSLAVEEQFYLVFPLLAFILTRTGSTGGRRRFLLAVILIIISSAIWCAYETHSDPVAAYYSPFTRVWELALGAAVFVIPASRWIRPNRLAGLIGWLALGSIVASAVTIRGSMPYPGTVAWWPVGSAAILLFVGKNRTGVGPELLLERRPVKYLGDISYSLYLWHYPILMVPMEYAVTGTISLVSRLELLLVTLAISTISFYVIENPTRRSRWLADRLSVTFGLGIVLIGGVWLATFLFARYSTIA